MKRGFKRCLALSVAVASCLGAAELGLKITVLVYDYAGVPAEVKSQAEKAAERTGLDGFTPSGAAGERADPADLVQIQVKRHEEASQAQQGRSHAVLHGFAAGAGLKESTSFLISSNAIRPG